MRVAQSLLRSAAAAGLVLLAAACVVPPPGVGPRPTELEDAAPDVSLYSFDSSLGNVGSGILSYSVTRDAYAAAFEVDRRGDVRLLSRSGVRDSTRVAAGHSYLVYPEYHTTDPEYANYSTDYTRIPFVFVVTADEPLDLSMFAQNGRWSRAVHTDDVGNPDSTTAWVGRLVARNSIAYGADYAYVAPRIYGQAQSFVSACARPAEDVHDYQYYRQLWAVFTPYDPLLGPALTFAFEPALGWSSFAGRSAYLPYAFYRAQLANAAFYGSCQPSATYQAYASGYPGAALLGGLGPYGFGYGYGYPYGTGVVPIVRPTVRVAPPLRLPRTPVAFGATQIAGVTTAPGAQSLGGHVLGLRPAGSVPQPFSWRSLDGRRRPGEVQPSTRATLGEDRPGFISPNVRHGFEPRAYTPRPTDAGVRGGGGRAFSEIHQNVGGGSGQAVARPQPTFTPRATAPMSSPSTGGGGASAVQARSEAKSGHN